MMKTREKENEEENETRRTNCETENGN